MTHEVESALENDDILVGVRLAGYQASRVPSGFTRTGLPAAGRPIRPPVSDLDAVASPAPPAQSPLRVRLAEAARPAHLPRVLRAERRSEARFDFTVPAAATYEASKDTTVGMALNLSPSGLQLQMPGPPDEVHVDLIVGDDHDCAVLWGRVVSDRPDDSGRHIWHVQVVSADEEWDDLLYRARMHRAS